MGKKIMEAHNKTNMVGLRFGKLSVIAATESEKNRARWVCQCDCGNKCVATGKTLREGKKQSCGCIKRAQSQEWIKTLCKRNELSFGEASCNHLYSIYRLNAKKRNFEYTITIDDFRTLTSKECYYCGELPQYAHDGVTCSTPYVYNGIDRVDNLIGYTLENCVTCCRICNWMKRTQSQSDFIEKCAKITQNINHKKLAEMTS
jgi:hypothetical protein